MSDEQVENPELVIELTEAQLSKVKELFETHRNGEFPRIYVEIAQFTPGVVRVLLDYTEVINVYDLNPDGSES